MSAHLALCVNTDFPMSYFDLHRHLEGALSPFVCAKIGIEPHNIWRPGTDFFSIWPTIISSIDCSELIAKAAYGIVQETALVGCKYVELQISPAEFKSDNRKVALAARRGMIQGEHDFGIPSGLIYNLTRHFPESFDEEIETAVDLYESGAICAVGIAGDESNFPLRVLKKRLQRLITRALPLTVHAGEFRGPDEIWEAMELGARRIGHGIAAFTDKQLMKRLADNQVALEICPTSEVLLGSVSSLESHPILDFLEAGIVCNINTDDPAIFRSEIHEEYGHFSSVLDIDLLNSNAQKMAFNLPPPNDLS